MKQRLGSGFALWLLVALLATSSAIAQNTSSAIGGRVTDASGKAVAGATVDILHVPSGTLRSVTTDANGRYAAQGLRVGGPFSVSVSKQGYEKTGQNNVYLKLAEETTLNLALGATATELAGVEVKATAASAIFQPDNKGININISARELKVLPNPDRSIQTIARMDPFISLTNNNSAGGLTQISALGQNNRYNNITIDAVPTNDSFGLEANGLPAQNQPLSYDAIEEYNISTANYDVTNKRSVGAAINIVTKSGTNDFHGSAYYAYTNANDLTGDDRNGNSFSGYSQRWTGGFDIGGPIVKDKLFFFLDYEEFKTLAPAPSFGPIGSGKDNIVPITQDQINQIIGIAKNYGMTPGNLGASSNNQDEKRGLIKLDWNISEGHRASLRYNQTKGAQPVIQGNFTGSRPALGLSSYWYTQNRKLDQTVLNLYDDWSDIFSTEASISYAKYRSTPSALANQPMVQVYVNKNDPAAQNASVYLGEDQFRHYNVLNVDTTTGFFAGTWFLGDHTAKAGFDYQRDKFFNLFGRTEFGSYQFNSISDFQAGKYSFFNLYQPAPGYTLNDITARWNLEQYGLFVQDTWQATDRFSLQYGIRYDLPRADGKPIYNAAFSRAFGIRNNATIGTGIFEPRFSFNYAFDTETPTQLRGGMGVSEGVTPGVWLSNPYTNNGITLTSATSFSGMFNPDPYTQKLPAGTPPTPEVDVTDPHFKLPTVLKMSLAFDRELPWWGTIFTAEYQHLDSLDSILYQNLNLGASTGVLPDGRLSYWSSTDPSLFANPFSPKAKQAPNRNMKYYDVVYLTNSRKGSADYFALQLKKPFTENLFGSIAAVIGRATDVNSGTSSQASSNLNKNAVFNPNEDVASPSNYDVRKRLVASLTWQHHFFGDYATSVSGFYDGHTGQPYSWVFGNDVSGICYGSSSNCPFGLVYIPRPGDVQFQSSVSQAAIQQFYDFIKNNTYLRDHQGGVAGRNGARAPWVNQVNLSFSQEVPGLFKGNKGVIKVDIFNFLNLLNKRWGQINDIDFPYGRTLANFAGVDPVTHKYIYSLPTDRNGNFAPGQLQLEDQYAQSRWSVLVTLRYTF